MATPPGLVLRIVIQMELTNQQIRICEEVVNAFESGMAGGYYGALTTNEDGPHGVHQISYGRSQTTEYGNLEELLTMYVTENGLYAAAISPYLPKIGVIPLWNDLHFLQLLKDAGKNDPIMKQTQDRFFRAKYFQPAIQWLDDNGFILPLSAVVVYDSYIQSGSILGFLRKRFPESVPVRGGQEKIWITEYTRTRDAWLRNHTSMLLRNSAYRTECLLQEIERNNWLLSKLPIEANGNFIYGI
ncbi:MAG: chitosanase [Marinilabiliales bacterium]|nr:chitosanase [Marinilabiliales bacterium]